MRRIIGPIHPSSGELVGGLRNIEFCPCSRQILVRSAGSLQKFPFAAGVVWYRASTQAVYEVFAVAKKTLVWKLDGRIGNACRPGDRVCRCQATVKMPNRNVKVNIFFVFSQFFNCFLCSKPTAQNTTASSRVREQQRLRSARVQAKPDIFPSVLAAAVITSVLYKFESGDMKEIERVELNWYIRTW